MWNRLSQPTRLYFTLSLLVMGLPVVFCALAMILASLASWMTVALAPAAGGSVCVLCAVPLSVFLIFICLLDFGV
jgi:hypothetical protein